MHWRQQAYTLYYRNVYILVFFRVFLFTAIHIKSSALHVGVKTLHNTIIT